MISICTMQPNEYLLKGKCIQLQNLIKNTLARRYIRKMKPKYENKRKKANRL